ncbi:hypothetical protein CCR85_03460 [Rhodothalassium salexigens]|uniref:TerC family protein n=1 Tax=Rhodothalassium salexigens TaxID=1086 RepID=UPI00191266CC|nr:TerC family protein [Rhodothalassium salexigens]MBK5910548.1 hypothetical protein [Rhodothalassium salexigens]
MALLTDPQVWASFATLALLEIILGIDNLIFLSVITSRLPEHRQARARLIGLLGALVMRIGLLLGIAWIMSLQEPFMSVLGQSVSWRDLILMGGGLFLLYKGTTEIHATVEGEDDHGNATKAASIGFAAAIAQIMALDMVFSLDSVITAVGMVDHIEVMIAAVTAAIGVMIFAADPVADFIQRHPTTKMLALSFLLLIGVALVADGLHFHIPRGYLYFAVGFSALVEALNLTARKRRRA